MNTFDIVETCVNGCDEVAKGYEVDSEKLDILRTYCDVIDDIMQSWGGSAIEVNIVTEHKYLCISLEVDAFTAMKIDQHYFDLIERCVCFATCSTKDQMVRMDFTFPSLFA